MSAYSDGLESAARIAFCDIAAEGVAGGLLFAGLTATTVAGLLGGLAVSGVSAHLYASYCGRPMPPEERGLPPFDGGQCPGVQYTIRGEADSYIFVGGVYTFAGRLSRTRTVTGPISAVDVRQLLGPGGDPNNPTLGGELRMSISAAVGSENSLWYPAQGPGTGNVPWLFNNFDIVISRNDGLPDICGNPPRLPPIFPPGGNVINNNIIYIDAGGNTINAPVTLRFGIPRIDVRGDFTIPLTINFDNDATLNIGGDVNFNTGDFTINVGGGNPPPGVGVGDPDNVVPPPTSPPPLPPGVPPDPPGTVPGEPGAPPATPPTIPTQPPTRPPNKKTYRVIRGVIVTTTQAETDATIIFQGDTPDIYAPSLGYISFLCKVGGAFGWTVDIPVKNRRQLIPCPWQFGAIEVKGTAKGGATFSLNPIYDDVPVATFPT